MTPRVAAIGLILGMVASGCGGEAATCDELADQTIDLAQELIDDVEDDVGDVGLDELLETGFELPAVDDFEEESQKIDERGTELGCTSDEMQQLVQSRIGRLSADTPIGQLIIDGIASGGI